jgi:hypothetical protein
MYVSCASITATFALPHGCRRSPVGAAQVASARAGRARCTCRARDHLAPAHAQDPTRAGESGALRRCDAQLAQRVATQYNVLQRANLLQLSATWCTTIASSRLPSRVRRAHGRPPTSACGTPANAMPPPRDMPRIGEAACILLGWSMREFACASERVCVRCALCVVRRALCVVRCVLCVVRARSRGTSTSRGLRLRFRGSQRHGFPTRSLRRQAAPGASRICAAQAAARTSSAENAENDGVPAEPRAACGDGTPPAGADDPSRRPSACKVALPGPPSRTARPGAFIPHRASRSVLRV